MEEPLEGALIKTEDIEMEAPSVSTSFHDSQLNFNCVKSSQITLLDGKFFEYIHDKSTITSMVGICKKCLPKHVEVKGYRNCTSNFISHLKRKHGQDVIEEYHEYLKSKRSMSCSVKAQAPIRNTASHNANDQQRLSLFDKNIIRFFINSMIPLKTVENPHFMRLFDDLNMSHQGLKIMNVETLKNFIEAYYFQQIKHIKKEQQTVDYVSIVVNIWPLYKYCFLCMSAHWIQSLNLQRKWRVLACFKFKCTESYDHINNLLDSVYSEFYTSSCNITDAVVEYHNSSLKPFLRFGISADSIQLTNNDDIDSDSTIYSNKRSVAHILNLCATIDACKILQGLKTPLSIMHGQVMEKCNALWKIVTKANSNLEQRQIIQIIKRITGTTLKTVKENKWKSFYDAFEQVLEIREKNVELHQALGIQNPIRDYEFDYIQEYLTCTKPIAEALDILQSESDTYYGIVLPCVIALRRKLQKLQKNEFIYCKPLIESYLTSLETRFSDYFNFTAAADNAIIATLSYPRFRNKWFSCVDPKHHKEIINKFKAVLLKEVSKTPNVEHESSGTSKQKSKDEEFFNFGSDSDSDNEYPKSGVEAMVTNFLNEENRKLDLLEKYPEIRNVFVRYNTPMPSSGSLENYFSYEDATSDYDLFEKRFMLKANSLHL